MVIWLNILEAFESIFGNRLRSFLTILGMVIGVAATISMLSVGRGAEAEISGEIEDLGTNLLFVFRGGDDDVRNPRPLTLRDAEAMMDPFSAPSVVLVAPISQRNMEVSYLGELIKTDVVGVTPAYSQVRDWPPLYGEFINEAHIAGRANVVLLGVEVADKLFGYRVGLEGEYIRINGQPFRIIGVMEERGGSQFENWDDRVIIPLSTAQTRLIRRSPADRVNIILVKAVDADSVLQAVEEVSQVLRQKHQVEIGKDDFTIFTQLDFLSAISVISNVLTIFLGGIAAVSLLVGGIGIMNIMLVSVIERTKEIGLRKALGARKIDILMQFLIESSVLSFIGGIGGIGLGWLVGIIVEQVAISYNASITPIMSPDIILLATLFSTAVGVFFGLYPAYRAANLEPVEALRSE